MVVGGKPLDSRYPKPMRCSRYPAPGQGRSPGSCLFLCDNAWTWVICVQNVFEANVHLIKKSNVSGAAIVWFSSNFGPGKKAPMCLHLE